MKISEISNSESKEVTSKIGIVSTTAEISTNGTFPRKTASIEGVTEYRLSNGLRILLLPDMTTPTITTNIVYLVGSRHENYGESGMAHLLEHLLFKPSANFGVKSGTKTPVEVLNSIGARFNGTTTNDRTNYFATFPASEANLLSILALEADRMVNSAIEKSDLWNEETQSGEMSVVRNEFEMGESDPINVTLERIKSVAFDWHSYGKKAMGTLSDIENIDIPQLIKFYRKYYQPDNAILMVAGRFNEASTLSHINKQFGDIARPSRSIAPTYTTEPVQDGERSVTIRRNGGVQFIGVGYHVAPSAHPDSLAIAILCRILTSAPGGRLHQALIEKALATQITCEMPSTLEPGYCIFCATVKRGDDLDFVREEILKIVEGFEKHPITEVEFARARQQILKTADMTETNTSKLALTLTESVAIGDWRLYFVQRDQLARIDLATVQATAIKYLKRSNRTVGCFVPTDVVDRTDVPVRPDIDLMVKGYEGREIAPQGEAFDCSPANIESRTRRHTFSNGMKCALLPKNTKRGAVSLVLQLRIGAESSLDGLNHAGLFAAAMLMRGTQGYSRQGIKDAFDRLSAQITINGNAEGVTANISTIDVNLTACLELLAKILRNPVFELHEFAELKREMMSRVEQDMAEPHPLAVTAFRRLLDPTHETHPHHFHSHAENIVKLESVTLDEVKSFHNIFYGASAALLAVVGDFNADSLIEHVERLFGSWNARMPYARIPTVYKTSGPTELVLEIADKPTCALFVVKPLPLNECDADYPSLLLADYMLGGGTMRSRLADRIRQKEGLSYAVGSMLTFPAIGDNGLWLTYCICTPKNVAKVQAVLHEELDRAIADGFDEEELGGAKESWRKLSETNRAEDSRLARRLAHYLSVDRTLEFDEKLEAQFDCITLDKVNEVLRNTFGPSDFCTVMVGSFAVDEKST